MHVVVTNFNGNPNIGLYGVITDKFVLLGKEVPFSCDKDIAEALGKEVHHLNIAGTGLLGVFCLWAQGTLLIPHIAFDHEKEQLDKLGVPYKVIETDLTCLGNNILCSHKAALVNPDFTTKEIAQLEEVLKVPVSKQQILDIEAVGAIAAMNSNKALLHRDIPPHIIKELERSLGVDITTGTLNMGNPYIKSAVLVNDTGFIVGDASGGPEIVNADEAFGFINQ